MYRNEYPVFSSLEIPSMDTYAIGWWHLSQALFKGCFHILTQHRNHGLGAVELVAIHKNQSDIADEILDIIVFSRIQLSVDCGEVHGIFDDFWIVRHVQFHIIDRM